VKKHVTIYAPVKDSGSYQIKKRTANLSNIREAISRSNTEKSLTFIGQKPLALKM